MCRTYALRALMNFVLILSWVEQHAQSAGRLILSIAVGWEVRHARAVGLGCLRYRDTRSHDGDVHHRPALIYLHSSAQEVHFGGVLVACITLVCCVAASLPSALAWHQ